MTITLIMDQWEKVIMQLGIISKLSMFFSSYTLLFTILLIKYYNNKSMIFMLILCIIGSCATCFILRTKINKGEGKILDIQVKNDQVAGYLVSYLLPFVGLNLDVLSDLLSLAIWLLIIGLLYIRSGLIYINPTLMLIGFNIYEVTFTNNKKRILITKKSINDLRLSDKISFYELEDRQIIVENF